MTAKLGVIVLAGPDNGGTYQYTLSMLQGLQHVKGFEITVYGDPQDAKLARLGYPIVQFSESRAQQLAALAAHRLKVGLRDPFSAEDVLLAPIYSLALLHTSKPFAYTLHDLQENYYPENFSPWQRIGAIRFTQVCYGRHAASSANPITSNRISFGHSVLRKNVLLSCGRPRSGNCQPEPGLEKLQEVRSRLQLPDRFLFYPAQFWVHKNHLRLIEAFREVVNEAPDLGLVLTGKKRDEYPVVMEAVERLRLGGSVRHLGYVEESDLRAIYRLAAALVMPSLFESISIPIYEAFQVGTPVVASGILAISEQVGDAGLLFDPTSVASIKDAILKVVGDPAAASLLGKRGHDRTMQMTPERYGDQLQDLLYELR